MDRRLVLPLFVLALAAAAVAGSLHATAARGAAPGERVLALVGRWGSPASELVTLDSLSLRPVSRRVAVGLFDIPQAFSPDGAALALGSGRRNGLRLVDLRRMRVAGDVPVGGAVAALSWPLPERLLAVVHAGRDLRLLVVDPAARRPLLERRLRRSSLVGASLARDALVLLLAPLDAIGPTRLAVFDSSGHVRSVTLARIRSGWEPPDPGKEPRIVRARTPGLANDPGAGRAFVFAADGSTAVVDLATLRVRYRRLPLRRLADGGNSLADSSYRRAAWLGDGLVAVSGEDEWVETGPRGAVQRGRPAGLVVLDSRTWRARTISPRARWFSTAPGLLFVQGKRGRVAAYGLGGARRFRLPAGRGADVRVIGGRAYVGGESDYRRHSVAVVDLATGRVLARPLVPGWTSVVVPRERFSWT